MVLPDAEASLDMSLDDVIASGRSGKGGRGRGRGWKGEGKGRSSPDLAAQGWTSPSKNGDSKPAAAALDMSLDDVIEAGKGRKGGGKGKGGKDGAGKWAASDDVWGSKESSNKDWGSKKSAKDWGGGGSRDGSWEAWASKPAGGGGAWGSWGGAKSDSWGKEDSWGGGGKGRRDTGVWGGGRDDSWGGKEPTWEKREPQRWEADDGYSRSGGWGGTKRSRYDDDAPPERPSKQIKVKNIPHNLDWRDIKSAFEAEAGKISRCELDNGTAWITFLRPEDARKAVDTFDRGELNGKTIEVSIER